MHTNDISMKELSSQQEHDIEYDLSDPVVKEIDVYLAKSLSNNVYVLQYPTKPSERNFDNSNYIGARIKPKQSKLELELDLNTTNNNYSKAKGEQFALNVDGKQYLPNKKQDPKDDKQQKYFRSNLMDKIVYTSTNATLGQMNRLYHLGILNEDKLHLNSIQSILQMKPSFEYFDIYEKKVKDLKEANLAGEADYSTEEEPENEVDKAELVTLRYSMANQSSHTQEPEQNWIPLTFDKNKNQDCCESLYCKNLEKKLKLDYTEEEFINRLIESSNSTSNSTNQNSAIVKTEVKPEKIEIEELLEKTQ